MSKIPDDVILTGKKATNKLKKCLNIFNSFIALKKRTKLLNNINT